jgi:hypothetical protein
VDQLAVPRCRLPLLKEREGGLSQHELGLKRARYNKEKARKTAHNLVKKQREEAGETVSPDSSDLLPFSRFECSNSDSSWGSVAGGPSSAVPRGDSSDDDGGDVPPGAGVAQHSEGPDSRGSADPSDTGSSASDPSDPKGKHVWEEGPAPEEEPADKRAQLVEPGQAPTTGAPAGGDGDSPLQFICNL